MKKYIIILSFITGNAFSQGIPTIDISNLIQSTITAMENIQRVQQAYTQIAEAKKRFENFNGDYLKGLILNNLEYQIKRRWLPEDYREVLRLYSGITNFDGFEGAASAGWSAREDYQLFDIGTYFPDTGSVTAGRWEQYVNNTVAAVGMSEAGFERASELIKTTESLLVDISTSPDAKAATDLNNRMSGQIQFMLAELLRINSGKAASSAREVLYRQTQESEGIRIANNKLIPSIE